MTRVEPSIDSDADCQHSWAPPPSRATLAWRDLAEGLQKSWLWTELALQDIRLRYRGSMLGPFWLTISTTVMVVAMGVLYAKIFRMDVTSYLPFLAVGLVLWQFVSQLVIDGCFTFLAVAGIMQQVRLPYSLHAYRLVCRNLLVLAHNAVIVPVVLLFFHVSIGWDVIAIVPGMLFLCVNGVWVGILFGMLSARFRDVPPIIASLMQMVFFVTPIFWSPDLLGYWKSVGELNPLYAALDIVRAPLLGMPPAPFSWTVVIVGTLLGSTVTFALFARFRGRIAFWVV